VRAAVPGVLIALSVAVQPVRAAPRVPDVVPGGAAAAVPCPDAPLSVRGGDADDFADACAGGAAAVAFLARHGLDTPVRIDVAIVDRMPAGVEADAAGCFDPARALVLLLDYAGFARFGSWFGRPIDRAMHRAIAAHEVAHAVSSCHFAMPRPGTIASEYVAYVTMFATMDPALREHLLAAHPDAPWADGDPPTREEYLESPLRFGARAWRHWLRQPDPAATLRAVIEGRMLGGGPRVP
jgi:hypothetical protein